MRGPADDGCAAALLPLPHTVFLLAAVSVITVGGPLTAYTIPAMSVITDSAERIGVALVVSSMLFNIAWAIGETIGAPAAASISQATTDAVPMLALAAVMVATFGAVIATGLMRPGASQPAEAEAGPAAEGSTDDLEVVREAEPVEIVSR